MISRISMYPEKCQLCGAPRELEGGRDVFHHKIFCNWQVDKSWSSAKKPASKTARDTLVELYESYLNEYLTVEVFAEHHGLTAAQGITLLALAREIWNTPHPEA